VRKLPWHAAQLSVFLSVLHVVYASTAVPNQGESVSIAARPATNEKTTIILFILLPPFDVY
jgi:hypothetical protein